MKNDNIEKYTEKEEINTEDFENIAGGKGEFKKGSAALMGSLMLLSGAPSLLAKSSSLSASSYSVTDRNFSESEKNIKKESESKLFLDFIKTPKISEAAEKAFNISNEFVKKYNGDHCEAAYELSSYRYSQDSGKTEIEEILDKACSENDLPIENYTLKDVNDTSKLISNSNKEPKFIFYKGLNSIDIHNQKEFSDGDVVNLASQFNALESPSSYYLSSVKEWPGDHTQGPYCALQSVEACKHREAASLQGKLSDALKDILDECVVDGKKITEKYPNLYRKGYLQPELIKNDKDLEIFRNFICDDKNIEKMKFLSQWVKCEGSEKMQLQVFTAAPSFSYGMNWKSSSNRTNLLKECCTKLIEVQYKALAQVAALRADNSGKNISLHVTMVGHGVFHNPTTTIPVALKALKENLTGHDVTVYLHCFKDNLWEKYAKELGIECTNLN